MDRTQVRYRTDPGGIGDAIEGGDEGRHEINPGRGAENSAGARLAPISYPRVPTTRAGDPATIAYGATSRVTTERIATTAPFPIVTPGRITTSL